MDSCDDILKQGIFNEILTKQDRSVSENVFEWLKTSTFSEVKKKIDAGLKVALPIKGIPVNIGANFTEDEFNQWKQDVDQGRARNFSEQESLTLVQRSVDQGIVKAWLDCLDKKFGVGLSLSISEPHDQQGLVLTIRYVPNDVTDAPPTVQRLDVSGAIPRNDLTGVEIEFGGTAVILQRQAGRGLIDRTVTATEEIIKEEIYVPVTVSLQTDKGARDVQIPAFETERRVPLPPPVKVPKETTITISGRWEGGGKKRDFKQFTHSIALPAGSQIDQSRGGGGFHVDSLDELPALDVAWGQGYGFGFGPGTFWRSFQSVNAYYDAGSNSVIAQITLRGLGGHGVFASRGDERYVGSFTVYFLE